MSGMMSSSGGSQHSLFKDRLARIEAGVGNTNRVVHIGLSESQMMTSPNSGVKASRGGLLRNLGYPLSFVLAFLTGGLAVVIARMAREAFSGGGLTGEGADTLMLMDGGIALCVGFALKMLFRLKSKELVAAQTVGIIAMVATMHNFVHANPDLWGKAFSDQWVAEVIATTEPRSILFRGVSFVLPDAEATAAAEPAEEKIIPKLIQLD